LVKHPTVLILDEPLQGLDPLNRQLVRRFVDVLIRQGETQLLFNEAMLMYPNHELALTELLNVLEKKTFTQPEEMKRYIPSLDN
ncbi:hypothetical protein MJM45_32890, partial [Salmonella enterica subsp. enterica serovar Kentucky]|nr:hypothetical protein [Salmonella enterica subsp. enterica serovar Kentucky]